MFLVDTAAGRIIEDDEIKSGLAAEQPYAEWTHAGLIHLEDLPEREHITHTHESVVRRQQTFGYTEEELRILLSPMAKAALEPLGSMGTDTPIAVLSSRPRLLFDYFTQQFAQVTNPPLDALREELVTSLGSTIGPEQNLLAAGPATCRQVVVPFPVIDNDELAKIQNINLDGDLPGFAAAEVDGLYDVDGGGEALGRRLREICEEVSIAIEGGRPVRRALRPRLRRQPRPDPVAAADLRGAPPSGAHEAALPGVPAGRGRGCARGPPRRPA